MKRKLFAVAALGVAFAFTTNAQDKAEDSHTVAISIPEVAILDLEAKGGTVVNLSVVAPEEAGEAVDFSKAVDKNVWLNYSSIVGKSETSRVVSAKISQNSVPDGMLLKVTAAKDAGSGDGTMGISTGSVTLSSSDQKVITGIGSCYTEDGPGSGHNLEYALELDTEKGSYAKIDFDQDVKLTITYTISNN